MDERSNIVTLEHGARLFRTLFISDVHLGARGCQAERLLDFLRWNEADTIYLVGDIVDGWQLKSGWYWPQPHNDVVQKLLRKARKGSRLIYLPGNHDEFLRDYYGTHFGGIEVVETATHEAADGWRCLAIPLTTSQSSSTDISTLSAASSVSPTGRYRNGRNTRSRMR